MTPKPYCLEMTPKYHHKNFQTKKVVTFLKPFLNSPTPPPVLKFKILNPKKIRLSYAK